MQSIFNYKKSEQKDLKTYFSFDISIRFYTHRKWSICSFADNNFVHIAYSFSKRIGSCFIPPKLEAIRNNQRNASFVQRL